MLNKADILFDSYELNRSYDYFNKAQLLCDTDIYYIEYVYALTCMAAIEQMQGDFVASEILLTKTLPHLKKIKNQGLLQMSTNNLVPIIIIHTIIKILFYTIKKHYILKPVLLER